jgi:hypothetical protein
VRVVGGLWQAYRWRYVVWSERIRSVAGGGHGLEAEGRVVLLHRVPIGWVQDGDSGGRSVVVRRLERTTEESTQAGHINFYNTSNHSVLATNTRIYAMNASNRISRLPFSPSCRQSISGKPLSCRMSSRRTAHFFACDRNWSTRLRRDASRLFRNSKGMQIQSPHPHRAFSATPAVFHGHLDKPKPGEEYAPLTMI